MSSNIKLWPSHRREIDRAIERAFNKKGPNIHNGKTEIDANILRHMLRIIDDKPDSEHVQELTDMALLKQEVLDAYRGWESMRTAIVKTCESNIYDIAGKINNMHQIMLKHEKAMAELVSKVLKK